MNFFCLQPIFPIVIHFAASNSITRFKTYGYTVFLISTYLPALFTSITQEPKSGICSSMLIQQHLHNVTTAWSVSIAVTEADHGRQDTNGLFWVCIQRRGKLISTPAALQGGLGSGSTSLALR